MRTASSLDELSDAIRSSEALNIVGKNSKSLFRLSTEEQRPDPISCDLIGIVDFSPADQVVTVRAGTQLVDLLPELQQKGQTLPFPMRKEFWPHLCGFPGTVGGTLSMNLPHGLEAQCGSWRDWTLGMTVVLADGTVAKSGSKVVKNVSGYDAHKLFIGARGSLGVIAEVTFRTIPIDAIPQSVAEVREVWNGEPFWIQRTLRTDFAEALHTARGKVLASDPATSTLWCGMEPDQVGIKFSDDWFVRSGYKCGDATRSNDIHCTLMQRAKRIFDRTNKLNPGEWQLE